MYPNDLYDGEPLESDYDTDHLGFDYDDYAEENYEDEDEFTSEGGRDDHGISVCALDTRTLTVEFISDGDTPLQYTLDEIRNYVEDNQLDFVIIHSAYTELDGDGKAHTIITFDIEGW